MNGTPLEPAQYLVLVHAFPFPPPPLCTVLMTLGAHAVELPSFDALIHACLPPLGRHMPTPLLCQPPIVALGYCLACWSNTGCCT